MGLLCAMRSPQLPAFCGDRTRVAGFLPGGVQRSSCAGKDFCSLFDKAKALSLQVLFSSEVHFVALFPDLVAFTNEVEEMLVSDCCFRRVGFLSPSASTGFSRFDRSTDLGEVFPCSSLLTVGVLVTTVREIGVPGFTCPSLPAVWVLVTTVRELGVRCFPCSSLIAVWVLVTMVRGTEVPGFTVERTFCVVCTAVACLLKAELVQTDWFISEPSSFFTVEVSDHLGRIIFGSGF